MVSVWPTLPYCISYEEYTEGATKKEAVSLTDSWSAPSSYTPYELLRTEYDVKYARTYSILQRALLLLDTRTGGSSAAAVV